MRDAARPFVLLATDMGMTPPSIRRHDWQHTRLSADRAKITQIVDRADRWTVVNKAWQVLRRAFKNMMCDPGSRGRMDKTKGTHPMHRNRMDKTKEAKEPKAKVKGYVTNVDIRGT